MPLDSGLRRNDGYISEFEETFMRLLAVWLINAIALLALPYVVPSIRIDGFATALGAALVLGLINAVIRPDLVPRRLRGGRDLGRNSRFHRVQRDLLVADAAAVEFAAVMNGPWQQHSGIRNEF